MSLSFFADPLLGTEQLWVTDGTAAGTRSISQAFVASSIQWLTAIGARAYFVADDGIHGSELWTSDGTAAGTTLLADINPGHNSSAPFNLTNVNGELYFVADDGVHGQELWKTDGTAAGTALVKDIWPGATGSAPSVLTNINGTLFFAANDPVNGIELWTSDGTTAGTVLVKDIDPGPGSSMAATPFANVNGTVFFNAQNGTNDYELWKSDGTAAGTVMVKDIYPGGNANPVSLINVNGTVFFDATDASGGAELWKSDGTAAGTVRVKDIDPGSTGSNPFFLTNVNGTLFFQADDGTHGSELWKSDGTAAGTVMVADINPGNNSSNPSRLVNVGGTLFFRADDGINGPQLWRSDGTAAGTVMVKNLDPGGSFPASLTNVNGVLEFFALDGTSVGLWRSDGTAAGTIEIATNANEAWGIGFAPQPVVNDLGGDMLSDMLWRNTSGALAGWTMNGGSIGASGALTSGGAAVTPGPTWTVAGISDFNGDGEADALWRNSDGTLVDWTMNSTAIASSGVLGIGGVAVKPDASWTIAGTGDFDGDSHADILWRGADGTLSTWFMNGANIQSSGVVTSGGVAIRPDASWSVAGIGDFNGDNRRDVLWRNASGEVTAWFMNGSTIAGGGDLSLGGTAVRPDASWSVAGIGDFNHDGYSDVLWRRTDGSLAEWLMNGTAITGGGTITSGGVAVTPDASWHVVELGDFNGDSNTDILWRSDSGAMAEWLMNGSAIVSSVTPASGAVPVSPDPTWSTQAKPTNFG